MPDLDARITQFVEGDSLSIRRTIDRTLSGLTTGVVVTKAWLTVKANEGDADPGLVQKAITTTNQAGVGQIEDDGTGDVDIVLRFDLTPTNTLAISTTGRFYDIQVLTDGGAIYTPEKGQIRAKAQVTTASS